MKKKGSSATTPQRKNSEAGEASDTSASVVWESATSVLSGKAGAEVAVFTMDDVDEPQVFHHTLYLICVQVDIRSD